MTSHSKKLPDNSSTNFVEPLTLILAISCSTAVFTCPLDSLPTLVSTCATQPSATDQYATLNSYPSYTAWTRLWPIERRICLQETHGSQGSSSSSRLLLLPLQREEVRMNASRRQGWQSHSIICFYTCISDSLRHCNLHVDITCGDDISSIRTFIIAAHFRSIRAQQWILRMCLEYTLGIQWKTMLCTPVKLLHLICILCINHKRKITEEHPIGREIFKLD